VDGYFQAAQCPVRILCTVPTGPRPFVAVVSRCVEGGLLNFFFSKSYFVILLRRKAFVIDGNHGHFMLLLFNLEGYYWEWSLEWDTHTHAHTHTAAPQSTELSVHSR
jgi:hypothetical protein